MMKLTVDRIEEGIAVCETEALEHVKLSLSSLPKGTKEGSVLLKKGENEYYLDEEAEEERRRKIFEKQKKLFS